MALCSVICSSRLGGGAMSAKESIALTPGTAANKLAYLIITVEEEL